MQHQRGPKARSFTRGALVGGSAGRLALDGLLRSLDNSEKELVALHRGDREAASSKRVFFLVDCAGDFAMLLFVVF